jgi:hypothetical protein
MLEIARLEGGEFPSWEAELALGRPVTYQLEGRWGGVVELRLGRLDAVTYRNYTRLAEGPDLDDGDEVWACRYVASRRAIGMRFWRDPGDVRQIADPVELRRWFAISELGGHIAVDIIPTYIHESMPDQKTITALEDITLAIVMSGEDTDPFSSITHTKMVDPDSGEESECDRDIWEDYAARVLIPEREMKEKKCEGCMTAYYQWAEVLKAVEDPRYGELTRKILVLARETEDHPKLYETLTVREYQYVQTVRAIQRMREDQRMREQQRKAEAQSKSRQSSKKYGGK